MDVAIAAKMLKLLENSAPSGDYDDTYFIIERLLKGEIRLHLAHNIPEHKEEPIDSLLATREESLLVATNKVRAIKMYRERTRLGLYDAKIAVEEGARRLENEIYHKVTSCA